MEKGRIPILTALLVAVLWTVVSLWQSARELTTVSYQVETDSTESIRMVQLSDLHGCQFGENNEELIDLVARSGAAWADIPARYGPHQTVYSRFCKWRDDGTLLRIFEELNADADYENLCIDSTSIKAHPQSAGAKKGL